MNAMEILKQTIESILTYRKKRDFPDLLRLTEAARLKDPCTNDIVRNLDLWDHIITDRDCPLHIGLMEVIKHDEINDDKRFVLIKFRASASLDISDCKTMLDDLFRYLHVSLDCIELYGFSEIDTENEIYYLMRILFVCS